MANPVVQVKSASGSGTSLTVTLDSAVQVGNIVVLVTNSVNAITLPGGFTTRKSFVGDQGFYIADHTAGAGETAYTVTQAAGNIVATVIELDKTVVQAYDSGSTVAGASASTLLAVIAATVVDVDGAYSLAISALHGYTGSPALVSATNGFTLLALNAPVGAGANAIGHLICWKEKIPTGSTGITNITHSLSITNIAGFHVDWGLPSSYVADPTKSIADNFNDFFTARNISPALSMMDKDRVYLQGQNSKLTNTDLDYARLASPTVSMATAKVAAGEKIYPVASEPS